MALIKEIRMAENTEFKQLLRRVIARLLIFVLIVLAIVLFVTRTRPAPPEAPAEPAPVTSTP